MSNFTVLLPNGNEFSLETELTESQAASVLLLVITSSISALAVLSLFAVLAISAWNTRKVDNPNLFVRSHAVAYLVCLLLCDLLQAIGSIMNAEWYLQRAVTFQPFCEAQGAIKHLADVGLAMWSLTIALHTFWLLFLRLQVPKLTMVMSLIAIWAAIATLVISGPASLDIQKDGPFYAISGYWCWISDQYPISRITLDYMFMFVSALLSFVLYSLVYLKIRGNIIVAGSRMRIRFRRSTDVINGLAADGQIVDTAKMMLIYPVAYTVIILPIAVVRFMAWNGQDVSFEATIFTDTVYLLSGTVNVVLFFSTRRVLPRHSVITRQFNPNSQNGTASSSLFHQSNTTDVEKQSDHSTVGENIVMFQTVKSPDAYPDRFDDDIFVPVSLGSDPYSKPQNHDAYPEYPVHQTYSMYPIHQAHPSQESFLAQQTNPSQHSNVDDTSTYHHSEHSHRRSEFSERGDDSDGDYYNVLDDYRASMQHPASAVASPSTPSRIRPLIVVKKHLTLEPLSSGARRSFSDHETTRGSGSLRAEYPPSALSPMRYPQSPLQTAPVKMGLRDSVPEFVPTSPISR